MKAQRGFSLIELLVVLSVIAFIAAATLALLTSAELDARDKIRISDINRLHDGLRLYFQKNKSYPTESSGANGNVHTNTIFKMLLTPHMSGMPIDPSGSEHATFYYYYDGNHNCGGKLFAVIFARQMEKVSNANYHEFLNTECAGILDGEGRGGGVESYNLVIGSSSG